MLATFCCSTFTDSQKIHLHLYSRYMAVSSEAENSSPFVSVQAQYLLYGFYVNHTKLLTFAGLHTTFSKWNTVKLCHHLLYFLTLYLTSNTSSKHIASTLLCTHTKPKQMLPTRQHDKRARLTPEDPWKFNRIKVLFAVVSNWHIHSYNNPGITKKEKKHNIFKAALMQRRSWINNRILVSLVTFWIVKLLKQKPKTKKDMFFIS